VSERAEQATAAGVRPFRGDGTARVLEALLPAGGRWEIEVGFGKGRYLLASAAERPERRFLGIEMAGEYFRLAARRLARRRLTNVVLLRGDALALLATRLPPRFAAAAHVYFPDPWPKKRHRKRRLFAADSVDLLLGALAPGGILSFATDFLAYGADVEQLLAGREGVAVERLVEGWPEGPRTNYEAKYVAAGRPILRLEARVDAVASVVPAWVRERLAVAVERGDSSAGEPVA